VSLDANVLITAFEKEAKLSLAAVRAKGAFITQETLLEFSPRGIPGEDPARTAKQLGWLAKMGLKPRSSARTSPDVVAKLNQLVNPMAPKGKPVVKTTPHSSADILLAAHALEGGHTLITCEERLPKVLIDLMGRGKLPYFRVIRIDIENDKIITWTRAATGGSAP
jgi:hypothetical protein